VEAVFAFAAVVVMSQESDLQSNISENAYCAWPWDVPFCFSLLIVTCPRPKSISSSTFESSSKFENDEFGSRKALFFWFMELNELSLALKSDATKPRLWRVVSGEKCTERVLEAKSGE